MSAQLNDELKAKFKIRIDGDVHDVELYRLAGSPERGGDGPEHFTVKIDDELFYVEVEDVGRDEKAPIKVNEQKPIELVKPGEPALPEVPGAVEEPKLVPEARIGNIITAPMPGKIVSVRVKVGSSVKVGDTLLTLEAMKMENAIVALKAGRIRELRVREGASVNQGDVLVIIE
jgi:biotin carboxyl carrier protein